MEIWPRIRPSDISTKPPQLVKIVTRNNNQNVHTFEDEEWEEITSSKFRPMRNIKDSRKFDWKKKKEEED